MKYRCIPCDHQFEVQANAKPRCPRCLKIHDLEPITAAPESSGPKGRKWIIPLAVVAAVGGLLALRALTTPDQVVTPQVKVEGDELEQILTGTGLSKSETVVPHAVTDRVKTFATEAAGDKKGIDALRALLNHIMVLRKEQRWTKEQQREPRRHKPLTADQLCAKLTGSDGADPYPALSYEVANLLYTAGLALGLEVKLAEIYQFDGEKRPADPEGKLGRYGVALGQGSPEASAPLFDPFSGRHEASAKATYTALDEPAAIAPYYALSALAELVTRNTAEALKLNKVATQLDPQNPYFRTGRGLIFAASGAPQEALAEFEKATKQRDNPVTRTNLAEVLILVDPTGKRAEASIQAALSAMPDYGRAHAVMAMIHVMRREFDQAEPALINADRLDPGSPIVAMFWAQYHATQGLAEEAIDKAQEAVRLSNESISTLMGLAGIYRATARFDEMRATLDQVIVKADSPHIAREIEQIFGYKTAAEDEDEEADDATATGGLQLKLGSEGGEELNVPAMPGQGLKLGDELDPSKANSPDDNQLKLNLE